MNSFSQAIANVVTGQQYLVFFIYGLVYFVMGFAVLLQSKEYSTLKIADHLWLLGVFGLSHGLADWAPLFIPLEVGLHGPEVATLLWFAYLILLVVSFTTLFYFGISVLLAPKKGSWFKLLPLVILLVWMVLFFQQKDSAVSEVAWRYYGSTWARYLLALPASTLTTLALAREMKVVTPLGSPRVSKYLLGATIMFALYAIVSGLIVPPQAFIPSLWINTESFQRITGLPVQLFRTLVGLGIAYFVIRYLEIFHLETRLQLAVSDRQQVLLKERERIGRDIHDGTMQSLYGLGLRLEHCYYLLENQPEHPVREHLHFSISKLNETIAEIRGYIGNMNYHDFNTKRLLDGIRELVGECENNTLQPKLLCDNNLPPLSPDQCENIFHLVKEALNNAAKHAQATVIKVAVSFNSGILRLTVTDNGSGFDPGENFLGFGLRNMRDRAQTIGGKLMITSKPWGTTVDFSLLLPKEEGKP